MPSPWPSEKDQAYSRRLCVYRTHAVQAHVSAGASVVHRTELVLMVNRRLVSCAFMKRAIQTTYQQASALQKWFVVLVSMNFISKKATR